MEVMARLLATMIDADFVRLTTHQRADRVRRASGYLPRRRSRGTCYVIAPQPAHLGSVLTPSHFLRGYERVVGWVVDSWLDERIPRMARQGHFDQLFITDAELVERWRDRTATPTSWLPFGTDALGQPEPSSHRPLDLLRVGRQPPAWSNNSRIEGLARERGVAFAPGPPLSDDPFVNQAALMRAMRRAKFTLSFTNLVSPAEYTHPSHDYVTGRWTDALASGARVAGRAPQCLAGQLLLWQEGLIDVSFADPATALDQIAEAADAWQPRHAQAIRRRALLTLDWRLRFQDLVAGAGSPTPRLDDELESLERRADTLSCEFDA